MNRISQLFIVRFAFRLPSLLFTSKETITPGWQFKPSYQEGTIMPSHTLRFITLFIALCVAALCLSPLAALAVEPWQNPNLSPNPWNNIHNQSWFNDSYFIPGPTEATGGTVEPISKFTFKDPLHPRRELTVTLGLCPAHSYTEEGNFASVCAGFPNPLTLSSLRSIVHISPDGELLAYTSFMDDFNSIRDVTTAFGGAGYFYQDQKDRLVMGMPNGHVVAWQRVPSPLTDVDPLLPGRDIPVIAPDGPIPQRIGSFYALLPDADGYIWFTTSQGVVGTIAPEPCQRGCVKWIDVNDPDGDGTPELQPGGLRQRISEAHSINENAMYQPTDHRMYRFDRTADGTPEITWSARYRRGTQVKPGQTSQGTGTGPSYFEIDDRQFVTIFDNARRPNIVVYRAEKFLEDGERRLFVEKRPFGNDTRVSDENSLIVYPVPQSDKVRIYAENNWGNRSLISTAGPLVTRPGFGGIEVDTNGLVRVLPRNRRIRVPSVVSKGNVHDGLLYTYNKTRVGWFLTALHADDPRRVEWTVKTGGGAPRFNNWYSQLSLAPGGETFYIGSTLGFLKVTPNQDPPTSRLCFLAPTPQRFTEQMRELAQWTDGPILYDVFIQAALIGYTQDFFTLWTRTRSLGKVRRQLVFLILDLFRSHLILRRADYDVTQLSARNQIQLERIADRHNRLLDELNVLQRLKCS